MFCSKCGKEITDNSKFCAYCGASVSILNKDTPQKSVVQENLEIDRAPKKKTGAIFACVLVTVVICIAIGVFANSQKKNELDIPVVYLTVNNELEYIEKPTAEAFQLSSFGYLDNSYYYNYDEDCVFYSDDGKILYYFDLSKGIYDAGGAPLYCVNTDEINSGQFMPTMIDEYAISIRSNTSYVMETLNDRCLIYMGFDYSQQCYALKYFDGSSSSTLIEGSKIYVTFNSEKTLANICIYHDTGANDDYSWYRMTINGNPVLEYVCDGTIYPQNGMYAETDFQTMVENDVILCMSDYQDEHGYYSVDLYVHGQWRENLIEKLPWFSRGPFGIKVGAGVSFFMITTVDLVTTTGQYYEGDSEQWTFYQYKNGLFREVSEDLRLQVNLPDNAISCDSIYCINDEVLFRYNNNLSGTSYDNVWVSFNESGECKEINDNSPDFYGVETVFTNEKGEQILVYRGYNGNSHPLYAYSNGMLKMLMDDVVGERNIGIYRRQGKELLIVYDAQTIYFMDVSDMDINTIENNFSIINIQEDLRGVKPYSDNEFLCILSSGDLLHWDGKKSEIISNDVSLIWSDYRKVLRNYFYIY